MNQSFFETIYNSSPIGIAQFDAGGRFVGGNGRWTRLLERYSGRPKGATLYEQLPHAKPLLAPLLVSVLDGQPLRRSEFTLPIAGNITYWDLTLTPLNSGFVIQLGDLTHRVSLQKRLERHIADRMQKLSALYDVMSVAGEDQDLRTTLRWSLERTLDAVRCRAGAIHLLDDFDEDATVGSLRPVVDVNLGGCCLDEALPFESDLVKFAVREEKTFVVRDVSADLRMAGLFSAEDQSAYIGVPMRARGRVIGLLSVVAAPGRSFTDIEIDLLDSVGDQIAVLVENGYLHRQAEELAVLEERNRLARELHDSVTQSLYSLNLFAEAGLRLVRSKNRDRLAECLRQLKETSRQSLKEMRLLVHELRPMDLEEEGLIGAIQQRLDAVEGRANVEAQLIVEGDIDELPDEVEEQLFRIAQEALNNALKHSQASLLTVRIRADDDQIELIIEDDGKGFDVEEAEGEGGMGLDIMEERVEGLDGELTVDSEVGEGTTIKVVVDLEEFEATDDIFRG